MTTVKVKFRQSSVKDREGTLFYQIIHLREVRQIYTDLHLSDGEWDGEKSCVIIPRASGTERTKYLSSVRDSLKDGMAKLKAIVSQLEGKNSPYTAQDVVTAFNSPLVVVGVVSFARKLIEDMKEIGKKAAAKRFELSLHSLLRYTGNKEVVWSGLTSTFVLGYEEFLIKRGLCRNSSSFYLRNLRSIVNRAIESDHDIPRNPFRHVYMGVDKTVKRAIPIETVCRIRDLNLTGHPALDFARDVFMFAFYTRGMSFVDMAFLKKSDVSNGIITYSRRKTRRQLRVRIEPEARRIIDKLGKAESPYLLSIITGEGDAEREYENAYNRVNRNIRKIGKMLGLETKLTLYVARHAWASIAHSNNIPLSTISKAMGHDSESTTLIYLQSLDTSSVDKANSDIIRMMDGKRGK